MTDHAAHRAEKLAAGLLNEYLDERLNGREPRKEDYLDKCPEQEKDSFWEAMQGVDYYMDYFHASHVLPEVVDGLIDRLEAVKWKKMWLAEAETRASHVWELGSEAPFALVAQQMNINTARLVEQRMEQQAGSARTFYRNETTVPGYTAGTFLTKAERFARERSLAARAQEVLDRFEICEEPIDLHDLARRLYLHVQEVLMVGSEGCLITDGDVGTILINRNIPSHRRRRFTLAHEIAHFILHKNKPIFEDDKHNLRFSAKSHTEIEANIFAAMLLMPPSLLPPGFSAERPSLSLADALIKRFDVSLVAALRRLVAESSWRCALVVSKGETICWSVSSPWFNGFISPGISPHPHTIARSLLEAEYEDENGMIMPAEVWVQGPLVEEEAKVREESRRVKSGYVYSLLTVIDPD